MTRENHLRGAGHALSTPFGALKRDQRGVLALQYLGACPLNALRGTETRDASRPADGRIRGHALSTPFGALKLGLCNWAKPAHVGHALSTPFGALKHLGIGLGLNDPYLGACPLNALRGTETTGLPPRGDPTRPGACPLNALRGTETTGHQQQNRAAYQGHALSTPFGALKLPLAPQAVDLQQSGHALSTPFGALKPRNSSTPPRRGEGGMPSQRPSGH